MPQKLCSDMWVREVPDLLSTLRDKRNSASAKGDGVSQQWQAGHYWDICCIASAEVLPKPETSQQQADICNDSDHRKILVRWTGA